MLETPHITQSTPQQAAVIHLTIPRDQIRTMMGPGIQEVIDTVVAQRIGPTGPVFSQR